MGSRAALFSVMHTPGSGAVPFSGAVVGSHINRVFFDHHINWVGVTAVYGDAGATRWALNTENSAVCEE